MPAPCKLLASLVCILALSGCVTTDDEQLINNGIGTDLYTADLYKETELLEQYTAFICVQANLPTIPDSGVVPANKVRCDYTRMTKPLWANFLIQGMNDIDRRCDAYLQWLDAKRRGKGALEKQIQDTDRVTQAILGFAEVSTKAISIVGAAFGLLTDSVENYHSRLLLEIDGSTVSTIVLTNRNKFRDDRNIYKAASKPEVVYVLRAYLRLCLPFAIEREINAFAAQGVQGISGASALSPLDPAKVVTAPVAPATATTAVFEPQRPDVTVVLGDRIEEAVQKALCVAADGQKGKKTIEAIKIYQYVRQQTETGELTDLEKDAIITTVEACNPAFDNFLERNTFNNDPANESALSQIRQDLSTLSEKSGANITIATDDTLLELRPKIAEIKKALKIEKTHETEKYLNNQYTPDLEEVLLVLEGNG